MYLIYIIDSTIYVRIRTYEHELQRNDSHSPARYTGCLWVLAQCDFNNQIHIIYLFNYGNERHRMGVVKFLVAAFDSVTDNKSIEKK